LILCRKPVVLHHVDALGLAYVGLALAASYFLVLAPWQEVWRTSRALAVRQVAAEQQLARDAAALEQAQAALDRLATAVQSAGAQMPPADGLARVLRELTDTAAATHLDLRSVTPLPAARAGDYVVNDVQVVAAGRCGAFIQFLDQLAVDNPYQSLQHCTLTRPVGAVEPACELSWVLRFYLTPDEPALRGGAVQ
jgi:Tfp pilus assembly protein PilO